MKRDERILALKQKIAALIMLIILIAIVIYFPAYINATENKRQESDKTEAVESETENSAENDEDDQTESDSEDDASDDEDSEEEEEPEPIIVVIDPGHGGENTGAICEEYIEKELTFKTALAMKRELEKYEGIEVYMTREDDTELSLTERTAYAKKMEADFFVCLHYNMSAMHKLYGAECWISSYGEYYAKGMDLAKIEMEMLTDLGLYDRGIKVRLNSKGTDYYGVIRSSTVQEIPSILIEHCHLDQENDKPFMDGDSWPQKYGELDATAVARYFGLKSDILGVDYSGEVHEATPVPDERVQPDTTPPEYCKVTDFTLDKEEGIARGKITAYDPESRILYYTASFNYGTTYHEYYRYEPDENGEVAFEIPLPKNTRIRMIIGALNMYGGLAKSELLYSGTIVDASAGAQSIGYDAGDKIDGQTEAPLDLGESSDGRNPDEAYPEQGQNGRSYIILAVCLLVLCFPLLLYYILWRRNERERLQKIKKRKMEYHYDKDDQKKLENELTAQEQERVERLLKKKSGESGKDHREDTESDE